MDQGREGRIYASSAGADDTSSAAGSSRLDADYRGRTNNHADNDDAASSRAVLLLSSEDNVAGASEGGGVGAGAAADGGVGASAAADGDMTSNSSPAATTTINRTAGASAGAGVTAAATMVAQPGIGTNSTFNRTTFAAGTATSGMLLGAAGSARRNTHFNSYPSSSAAPAPLSTRARMIVAGGTAPYEDGRRLLVANAPGPGFSSAGMLTSTEGANGSTSSSMLSSSSRMLRGGNTCVPMLGIRGSSSFGSNNNYANTSLIMRRNNALLNSGRNNADTMVGGGGLSFTDRVNIASAAQLANQDHDMQGRMSSMLAPNSLQHQHPNAAMFVSNSNTAGTAGVRYYSIDGTGLRDNLSSSFRSGAQNDIRLNREFLPRASNTGGAANFFPGNPFINRSFNDGQAAGIVNDVSFIYGSRVALTPEEEDFRWMAQFYALRRFKEEFGHCNVPM